MKKALALVLSLLMLFSLTACGGEGASSTAPAGDAAETEKAEASKAPQEEEVQYTSGYVETEIPIDADNIQYMARQGDAIYLLAATYPDYSQMEETILTGEASPEGEEESPAPEEEETTAPPEETTEPSGETEASEAEEPQPVMDYSVTYTLLRLQDGEITEEKLDIQADNFAAMGISQEGKAAFLVQDSAAADEYMQSKGEGYTFTEADWQEMERLRSYFIMVEKDGKYERVGETGLPGTSYYNSLTFLPGGGFALGSYQGIVILDENGEETRKLGSDVNGIAVQGDTIYTMEYSGGGYSLTGYSVETGETTSTLEPPKDGETVQYFSSFALDDQGRFYLSNEKGVVRYDESTKTWEKLLDGVASVFGSGDFYTNGFAVDSDASIYVYAEKNTWDGYYSGEEGSRYSVFRYDWSDKIKSMGDELNIVAAVDFSLIRTIANRFQRLHPEVKVNYRTFGAQSTPQMITYMSESTMDWIKESMVASEDAVRAVNTEMLAGSAADVLVLDGLPIDSYVSKGYMMDLTEWAAGRESDGTWMPNVATAFKTEDGAIPCIPISVTFPMLWGVEEELEGVSTLSELAAKTETMGPEEYYWSVNYDASMATTFYAACQNDWLDDKGRIDFSSAAFKEYLEYCKILQDTMPPAPDWANMQQEDYEKYNRQYWSDMMEGRAKYVMEWAYYQSGYEQGNAIMQERAGEGSGSAVIPLPSQSGKNVFIPQMMTGVSKDTKVSELAYEFMDMLFAEENQKSWSVQGYPLNKAAFDASIALPDEEKDEFGNVIAATSMGGISYGEGMELKIPPMDEALNEKLHALYESMDTAALVDMTLLNMIYEETIDYFAGKTTLDATVAALNSRARAYLME